MLMSIDLRSQSVGLSEPQHDIFKEAFTSKSRFGSYNTALKPIDPLKGRIIVNWIR